MDLQTFILNSHETAKKKGWWDEERPIGDILTNIHAELSEAWEEYRKGKPLTEIYFGPDGKPEGFPVELADTLIRIADVCGKYGIAIEHAIALKMAYNDLRPYRHGGKLA